MRETSAGGYVQTGRFMSPFRPHGIFFKGRGIPRLFLLPSLTISVKECLMKRARSWAVLFAGSLLTGGMPVAAKVVFTGYADMRATPQSDVKISGSDTLLSFLNVTDRKNERRGFAMDALGVFAATALNERTDFLMDITYRRIGVRAEETRLQYAYAHYRDPRGWEAKVGRVTIPLGLYNESHFYPFQRDAIQAPLFQSGIIGLPIADNGAVFSTGLDVGGASLSLSAFAVNGYGSSRVSTDSFRAGLGVTDTLLIANNLAVNNSNASLAYGGRLQAAFLKDRTLRVGVSGYQGPWDAEGKRDFTMLNGYIAAEAGRASVLVESLKTMTQGDAGVTGFFGSRGWQSCGAFLEGSYRIFRRDGRELNFFAGTEETLAEGTDDGARGRERLIVHKTGLSWKINPSVILKAQASQVDYSLPIQFGGSVENVVLRQRGLLLNMVLTY
jgi:hypothetical protein